MPQLGLGARAAYGDQRVFLLILMMLLVGLVTAAVIFDQVRLQRRRQIERGFRQVSAQVSRRLQFRRPVLSDREFFLTMASDPVAAEANGWHGDESKFVDVRFANRRNLARHSRGEMLAFERSTNTPVGTATFSLSPLDGNARSIGIHVHPDHRGKGYGREIMAAAITLLQYEPGPVHVGTRVNNHGMQKIMQQLGYEPEPDTHPYVAPNGETYDAYWYFCGADTHPPAGLLEP